MSTDSRFVHKIWQAEELSKMVKGGVPFPMLSDAGGKIGQVYGVYDEAAGVDIRGRFIIDPDFVIRAMEVLTPEVGRNSAREENGRGHALRLAARPGDVEARPGARGQGMGGVEALMDGARRAGAPICVLASARRSRRRPARARG
jgi:hypothetical protein